MDPDEFIIFNVESVTLKQLAQYPAVFKDKNKLDR